MQAIFVIVFLIMAYNFFAEASGETITLIILGAIATITAFFMFAAKSLDKDIAKANMQRAYIREKSQEYERVLAKKRTQLIVTDDYGDEDDSKWKAEIVSFFNSKIKSIPSDLAMANGDIVISAEEIAEIIDGVAKDGQEELDDLYAFSDDMDGIEYEHFCAKLLRDNGWTASVSPASNDQGADIIATRNGTKVAVQCKKYSKPVGNKAVQEVSAGKLYYDTDYAVVVTNNMFTSSAKLLANSTKVVLLHHSDLASLDEFLVGEI